MICGTTFNHVEIRVPVDHCWNLSGVCHRNNLSFGEQRESVVVKDCVEDDMEL